MISQYESRYWFGASRAPGHFLNQSWPSFIMHMMVTRPQWINENLIANFNEQNQFEITDAHSTTQAAVSMVTIKTCYLLFQPSLSDLRFPSGSIWSAKSGPRIPAWSPMLSNWSARTSRRATLKTSIGCTHDVRPTRDPDRPSQQWCVNIEGRQVMFVKTLTDVHVCIHKY